MTQHAPPEHHDQIRADRACIGCGFNLYGQTVLKEPHYGLAIARCPECGVVAALQQYPAMTHWVNRFRAIMAAIYVLFLLGAFVLTTMVFSAFATATAESASTNLANHVGRAYSVWEQEQVAANPQGAPVTTNTAMLSSTGSYQWVMVSPEWAETRLDATIDSFGSLMGGVDREAVLFLLPSGVVAFCIGVFWSVLLLGATRRRALLAPLAACAIGLMMLLGLNQDSQFLAFASSIARKQYTPLIGPIALASQFALAGVGVWAGRKLARFMACLALPPRGRVPLSHLWERDGLELPRPGVPRARGR